MPHEDNAAESGAQAPDGALDRYGNPADHPSFNQFVATISALRAPDGCPWDREQTHVSISHNMIEEAYEAVCAIEEEDVAHLREELGDVLLQVVLQSQIAADAGEFTIDDVCADVNAKMVRRHPHVFGSVEASNASEVLDVWDQVKLAERQATGGADGSGASEPEGLLDGVPRTFPALMEAQKISRKAAAVGFEWDSIEDVWDKVAEEKAELIEAYAAAPHAANGKIDTSVAGVRRGGGSSCRGGGDGVRRCAFRPGQRGQAHGDRCRKRPSRLEREVSRPLGSDGGNSLRTGETYARFLDLGAKRALGRSEGEIR